MCMQCSVLCLCFINYIFLQTLSFNYSCIYIVRIDYKSGCMGDSACSDFLKSSCPFNTLKSFSCSNNFYFFTFEFTIIQFSETY